MLCLKACGKITATWASCGNSALLTNCVYEITCSVNWFPLLNAEWNKHSVHASLSLQPITALSPKIVFAQIRELPI